MSCIDEGFFLHRVVFLSFVQFSAIERYFDKNQTTKKDYFKYECIF